MSKKVELPGDISISIPRNFPKFSLGAEGDARVVSFNIQAHEKSKRFIHFFEIIISPDYVDILKRLPQEGYKLSKSQKEELIINGHSAFFKSIDLEITRSCGSKEKTRLFLLETRCENKNLYIGIVTFTMTKDYFREIVKTLKCH